MNHSKQTQSNPIYSELVEPISKGMESRQVGLNKLFRRVFCVPIGPDFVKLFN